jgi:NADH-quinone oxidoreductase subunit L
MPSDTMPQAVQLALVVLLLPLGAFTIELLHALVFRRLPSWSDKLSTVAMFGSLAISVYLLFTQVIGHPHGIENAAQWSMPWMNIGAMTPLRIDFSILVDNLTVIMLVVVTGVSALVHLYSTSYMHGEKRYPRFFSYLSLFTFSMLGLVITSNLLLLFMFWELVGVCSYFLIGFYIEKKSAGDASKKAFITNRVGDACFMTGIMIVFAVLSSWKPMQGQDVLSFQRIYESIGLLGTGDGPWNTQLALLTAAGILVFMGCVTKSAQFPLHIWLPDAMEGPTPVSALIHAATMVAAGVYLIARMFPLIVGPGYLTGDYFHGAPAMIIAMVGGFTSLFAGSIALVQQDLKKGLAYSTVSQLGYMSMAVGVGSVTGGMFHLFTHAFFKACLFLGAGSVIHAVHSQFMGDMGGLRRKMPVTFWTFLVSTLAIAGVPLFSGFLSKEMVLTSSLAFANLHEGSLVHKLPFIFAALTAILTAFYMFRMIWLTFFGKGAWEGHGKHDAHEAPAAHGAAHHAAPAHAAPPAHGAHAPPAHGGHDDHGHREPHESHWQMALPLAVLGTLAIVSAGIALPGAPGSQWFEHRVSDERLVKELMTKTPAVGESTHRIFETQVIHDVHAVAAPAGASEVVREYHEAWHHAHVPVLAVSAIAIIFGIGGSWFFFMKKRGKDYVTPVAPLRAIRTALVNLWYVDAFFVRGVAPFVMKIVRASFAFDKWVIDALVNAAAWVTALISRISGSIDQHGVDGAVRGTGTAVMEGGQLVRKMVTGRIQDYVKFTVVGLMLLVLLVRMFAR